MSARACVIGWPIAHSRSPLIHNYWLKKHGIDGVYSKEAVPPEELSRFIAALGDPFIGCNVTIPHKEEAFRLVPAADEATRRLGSLNTLFRRDSRTLGTSTDGEGFLAHLAQSLPRFTAAGARIVMLGAGGAAAAIAGALADAGAAEIRIANRTRARAVELAQRIGPRLRAVDWEEAEAAMMDADLLINTTALGMTGKDPLIISPDHLPQRAAVADIVYVPLETPLLAAARARGLKTVDGLGMLLHQAVRGFELWFGVRPHVTAELRALIEADL
jgi:shikimate dehydrogenase